MIHIELRETIFSIEDGTLYRHNSSTGKWQAVGKEGEYKNTIAIAALDGKLYSVETNGTLYETKTDGTWRQIGDDGEFQHLEMLVAMGGFLWTVEGGTL